MTISKNTVQVNNGNPGWSSSNILDALEETFADLGWNSGTQVNGMVTSCYPPTGTIPWNNDQWDNKWLTCGGANPTGTEFSRDLKDQLYFIIDDRPNNLFSLRKLWYFTTGDNNDETTTGDYITIADHGFTSGDSFYQYQSIHNRLNYDEDLYSGAVNGDTVYVSVIDDDNLHLHATEADALAPTLANKIDITGYLGRGFYLALTTTQTTIDDINQSDTLYFMNYETSTTTDVYIQDSAGAYDSTRAINTTNYNTLNYRDWPNHDQPLTTVDASRIWDTQGWQQGTYYLTGDAATYSIPFNILPSKQHYSTSGSDSTRGDRTLPAYYDYTVPADGARSALNLRIFRRGHVTGGLYGVQVLDLNSSGWSDNESFTIPGDAIGGTTPANDIVFGTNTAETVAGQADGICNIKTTNIGEGVNSYLKNYGSKTLIVRIENDASKNYGTTFYKFQLEPNNYQLSLISFIDPDFRNYDPQNSGANYLGVRGGDEDLDWSASSGALINSTNDAHLYSFTGSETPTAYELKIVTYQATNPQDTDFAVISFVRELNGVDTPYFTFSINKGTGFGSSVWDLDYVWQGSYTVFSNDNHSVSMDTTLGRSYVAGEGTSSTYKMAREALYGYTRDVGATAESLRINYASNRWFDNDLASGTYYGYTLGDAVTYYRDSTYDKADNTSINTSYSLNINDFDGTGPSVSSSANFDRVMKGLPLANNVSPSLYYLPDDFVMIDFNYTPGATTFLIGDTITISASEVYEVIRSGYTNAATTYDGIASNSVHGILFCARTT